MLRTRLARSAAVSLLTLLLLAPAGISLAGPAEAPQVPSLVSWLADWWQDSWQGWVQAAADSTATDAAEAFPNIDPDGISPSETPGDSQETSPGEGETFPNIDPNG